METGTENQGGQPETGTQAGTTGTGTSGDTTGQSVIDQGGTTGGTTGTQSEDIIYDPEEFARITSALPPELQAQAKALQKQLQGNYSKKTAEIAKQRAKVEAYDAFYKNPAAEVQRLAAQMGYKLTRAEAQEVANQQQESSASGEWEPKSWNEVTAKIRESILGELAPVLNEVKSIKRSAIENQLAEIDPTWQQYEDAMIQNLTRHPSLSSDPVTLYRISVPAEVLESRATQRALAKLENKTRASGLPQGSTTTKIPKTGLPDGPVSFADAVKAAKAALAEQGIRPG